MTSECFSVCGEIHVHSPKATDRTLLINEWTHGCNCTTIQHPPYTHIWELPSKGWDFLPSAEQCRTLNIKRESAWVFSFLLFLSRNTSSLLWLIGLSFGWWEDEQQVTVVWLLSIPSWPEASDYKFILSKLSPLSPQQRSPIMYSTYEFLGFFFLSKNFID